MFPVETATWRRAVRRVLELVVAIALLVFIFSPGTHTGLRYVMAAAVVLFLFLSVLRKWP
jgi:hypothetical protein